MFRKSLILILCYAQFTTLIAQNDLNSPLSDIIDRLEANNNVFFSYDPDIITGFVVDSIDSSESLALQLKALENQLPFAFELTNDKYILIKPTFIQLSLQILDDEKKDTIPGAYVRLNDHYLNQTSDQEGMIALSWSWEKYDTLTLSSQGFESRSIAVKELLQKNVKSIFLKKSTTFLPSIVIKSYLSQGINAVQKNHSLEIDTHELGMLPGDNNKDLLTSLRTLPGIHTVTGRAGELRVRGGTPDQTLILFNNIPIYHKGHYFGTISPFSSDIVDKVHVYRSGYIPRLGGRVGGAVEIETSKKFLDSARYGINSNSYFGGAYAKVPLIKNKLDFSFSARASHPWDYRSPKEEAYDVLVVDASQYEIYDNDPEIVFEPIDYSFYDMNGSLNLKPYKSVSAHINFIDINNFNTISFNDLSAGTLTSEEIRLDNRGLNLAIKKEWEQWDLSTFFTRSFYDYTLRLTTWNSNDNTIDTEQNVINGIDDLQLGLSSTKKLTGAQTASLSFGYDFKKTSILFHDVTESSNNMRLALGPGTTSGILHSIYTNFFLPDVQRFSINVGVRSNYHDLIDVFNVEPRIFINHNLSDRLTLKSSFGLYNQYLSRTLFFEYSDIAINKLTWRYVRRKEDVISSTQALVGASYSNRNWVFDVDIYYKYIDNLQALGPINIPPANNSSPPNVSGRVNMGPGGGDPNMPPPGGGPPNMPPPGGNIRPLNLYGSMVSMGMDFLFKYSWETVNLWTNYTLSSVTMSFDVLKTEAFPSNYDQTHKFNISGAYAHRGLRASIGWYFASGIPNYIEDPFFPSLGLSSVPLEEPDALGPLSRFNPTHQLDASVSYQFSPKGLRCKVTVGLSALNIYDRSNLLETANVRLRTKANEQEFRRLNRYTVGFAPDFMIKIDW